MADRDLSFRELARATREVDGRGLTHSYLNMSVRGHDLPSERAMELLAEVFGVRPAYFAEYRLLMARRQLDPAQVGFEHALANLRRSRLGGAS